MLPWYDDTARPGGPGARPDDRPDDRPAVVLLHAFPLSSVMYDRLVPALGDDVRVVRVDLPGLGRSAAAAAASVGEPSVAAMADGVAAVLDRLGVVRATVLGISTGGYAALELAARRPDLVAGLALGSTTSRVIAPDVPAERRALAADLDAAGTLEPVLGAATQGLGPTARREQPALAPLLRGVVAAGDPAGVAWAARAVAARRDTTDVLLGYAGPVLLLNGAEDQDTPPVRAAEMAAVRAGAGDDRSATRSVVLPATGHLTALERPASVAAELLRLVADAG